MCEAQAWKRHDQRQQLWTAGVRKLLDNFIPAGLTYLMLTVEKLTRNMIKSKTSTRRSFISFKLALNKDVCCRSSIFLSESSSFIPPYRLLSTLWLSISADYSSRPDFHPPVYVCMYMCVVIFPLPDYLYPHLCRRSWAWVCVCVSSLDFGIYSVNCAFKAS